MLRREFLQLTLAASAAAQSTRPPNIVVIMADDFGYECLACNGATEYKTPRIDALAAAGVRFTNAHSTPLCTPTRVQLMTGKYNVRNYTEFGSLPHGESTFAHLLKAVHLDLMPQAYAAAARFWVYPIFLVIVIGTWRTARRRVMERHQTAIA